ADGQAGLQPADVLEPPDHVDAEHTPHDPDIHMGDEEPEQFQGEADINNDAEPAVEGTPPNGVEQAAAKKRGFGNSRDFMKPQFIDFTSPLLVELFNRLPATLKE